MKSHFAYYGEYSIESWIAFTLNGEVKLPPYQRSFVWKIDDVYKLVKSIVDGQFVPPVTIAQTKWEYKSEKETMPAGTYLIDGQQRLCSILLFYLGVFPSGTNTTPAISDDDDEIDSVDWTFSKLQKEYVDCSSVDDLRNKLQNNPQYACISNIKPDKTLTSAKLQEISSFHTELSSSNFSKLLTSALGYSFIKSVGDEKTEKRMLANVFKDINSAGVRLTSAESREAIYYLAPELMKLFKPDVVSNHKIGTANGDTDFARFMAYPLEYYLDETQNKKVAYGYSDKSEEYILKQIVALIEDDEINKKAKQFIDNISMFSELFAKIFSEDKRKKDIPTFELYVYGLIYWVLFDGKDIDASKTNVLDEAFEKYAPDVTKVTGIRVRLNLSIETYREILRNG
ncbi:hypothetical protein FACS1894219_12020 [Clostridia bacterium]|nr:hypothetical protein FACS1894219_12020 [Clostridia bacterium]